MKATWSQLVHALNAPITIWFLSVVAVGLFGSAYADMQQCRVEADRAVKDFNRIGTEIGNRREVLYRAIADASSMDELRDSDVVRNWNSIYTYLEFKGRTSEDLEDEYVRVGGKLVYFPPIVLDMTVDYWQRLMPRDSSNEKEQEKGSLISGESIDRANFSKLSNGDLPGLKSVADRLAGMVFRANVEMISLEVIPMCGPVTALQRVIFGQPDYVAMLKKRKLSTPSN